MQRINSVYDWSRLPFDNRAQIVSDIPHQRAVRLRVNAPEPMALFIQQDDIEDEIFLAHIVGLDEIQFDIIGSYWIVARGGDVWFDTLDGANPSVEPVEPASFTQIVERRVRNPEMELMQRKMEENITRRMDAMVGQFTAVLSAKDQEIEAARTTAAKPDSEKPKPADGTTPSGEPVTPVGDKSGSGEV